MIFSDRLLTSANVSAKVSGTAAVVCVLHGRTLWVANAGDSRAVLAYSDTSSDPPRTMVKAQSIKKT